jgi:hypothetical protein
MRGIYRKLGIVAVMGTLVVAGAGCSALSSNHVDCNVVKLQEQAGRSDAEIASALGVSEADVAACHGPEKSGNSEAGGAPGSY